MSNPLRLLLVDDDPLLLQLMQLQLAQFGYQCELAPNGAVAVSAALSYSHDVILMDWQMPELDGLQAAELLRQLGYRRPIFLLTADPVDSPFIDLCLEKPVSFPQLHALLQQQNNSGTVAVAVPAALIAQFYQDLPRIDRQLQQAAAQLDVATIKALVHQLKGSAASFGAESLSKHADQLQQLWQHQAVTAVQLGPLLALIKQELEKR